MNDGHPETPPPWGEWGHPGLHFGDESPASNHVRKVLGNQSINRLFDLQALTKSYFSSTILLCPNPKQNHPTQISQQ